MVARREEPAGVKPSLESRSELCPSTVWAAQELAAGTSSQQLEEQARAGAQPRSLGDIHRWHQEQLLSAAVPVAESQQADTVWHISQPLAAVMTFGCISSLTRCYSTAATLDTVF